MLDIHNIKWWWLLAGAIGGIWLSALMAWNDGILKLYNDIPSVIGYLSVMLIIYNIGIGFINSIFVWASTFCYELYLVHSLVFVILAFLLKDRFPVYIIRSSRLILAYTVGFGYSRLMKRINCNEQG